MNCSCQRHCSSVLLWVPSQRCPSMTHCGAGCTWLCRTKEAVGSVFWRVRCGWRFGGILYLHAHGYLHIRECSIYCFLPVPVVATVPALWLSLLEKHLLHRLPLCRGGGGVPSLPTQFRNNDFVFVSGHLHVKSGEKMSKSLKNYITIKVTCFS